MKSFAKKFLSIALAAVLLLGVLPFAAFEANAAEGDWIHYWADAAMTAPLNGTTWDQELVESNPDSRIAAGLHDGKYTLADWNLPAMTDKPGFIGWFYCAHPEDQAVAGEVITSANLFPKYETASAPEDGGEGSENAGNGETVETPAASSYMLRYYQENGTEITEWNQEISKSNTRVAPNLNADGSYKLQDWNLPMNIKDPTGQNRTFLGWAYKNHADDMANIGDVINSETNLIQVFKAPQKPAEPAAQHTVTLYNQDLAHPIQDTNGKNVTFVVAHGAALNMDEVNKFIPTAPKGMEFDSWRFINNVAVPGKGIYKDEAVIATFRENVDYNPRPDGPQYLFKLTFDENWAHGSKTTYEIKDNQRLGTLFANGHLPVPSRNLHVFRGWFLEDTNKQYTEETIFTLGRNATLKARWADEARVKLMIYRNGKTDAPYDVIQLYGYGVGETIDVTKIDIKDYYKNGGKPFKFEGWFDRGGWTLFKAKDNPHPITSIQTADLDATTTLFCMITDNNAPSNKTPDHTNPKTGDESMIFATTAVMLVSAGALAVFFMDRKRRNG